MKYEVRIQLRHPTKEVSKDIGYKTIEEFSCGEFNTYEEAMEVVSDMYQTHFSIEDEIRRNKNETKT